MPDNLLSIIKRQNRRILFNGFMIFVWLPISLSGCTATMPQIFDSNSKYQDSRSSDENTRARVRMLINAGINGTISYMEGIKGIHEIKFDKIRVSGINLSNKQFIDIVVETLNSNQQVSFASDERFIFKISTQEPLISSNYYLMANRVDLSLLQKGYRIDLRIKIIDDKSGVLLWSNTFSDIGKETFIGKLEGLDCIIRKYECAVDKFDPLLYREPDIILEVDNQNYYRLSNLPMRIKYRYYRDDIRVIGTAHSRGKQITVNKLQVIENGKFITVWDAEKKEPWYVP